jgi:hypothetical protein
MEFLINPTVAFFLIVTIATVLSLTILDNKFTLSRYGIILCLVVVVYELFYWIDRRDPHRYRGTFRRFRTG